MRSHLIIGILTVGLALAVNGPALAGGYIVLPPGHPVIVQTHQPVHNAYIDSGACYACHSSRCHYTTYHHRVQGQPYHPGYYPPQNRHYPSGTWRKPGMTISIGNWGRR